MSDPRTLEKAAGPSWLGWHALPDIHIDCQAFSGPLALLLNMVREGQVELKGVALAPVCEAYLAYILAQPELDVDQAAVALSALAWLVERKSAQILPNPQEEEPEHPDIPEDESDWTPALLALFSPAIEALSVRREQRDQLFFRTGTDTGFAAPLDLDQTTVNDLARAFQRLLEKAVPEPPILGRPRRSMAEMIEIVLRALPDQLTPLDALVPSPFTRTEAVWWFLALLELIRLGQCGVTIIEGEPLFVRERPA